MNVFDLIAKITMDTSDYEKSLSGAEKNTASFAQSIGSGIKKSAKIGAAAVGAVTAAVTLTGKKIYSGVSELSSYGDAVDKTSQKVGMSAEAYQAWDYVMKISGTEMSNMTVGLKTLTNKFDDAKSGGDASIEMFKKLGLSMDDIKDLSREDLFSVVISQFQQMGESTERAALANDLFGRSGQDLVPLFNTTSEETQKLKQEAKDYGMVMSSDAVKASATFQDRLTRLGGAMRGVKQSIYSNFLPGVTSIVEGFADVVAGNENANDALSDGFTSVIDNLSNSLPRILQVGGRILESLAKGIVKNLPKITSAGVDIIVKLTSSLINSLPELAKTAVLMLDEIIDGISKALPELIPMAAQMVVTIGEGLARNADKLISGAAKMFSALIQGFSQAIPIIAQALPGIIQELVTAISNNFEAFLPAVGLLAGKSILGGIIGGLKDNALIAEMKDVMSGKGGIVAAVVGGVVLLMEGANKEIRAAYATAKEEASKLTESQQKVIDKIHEEASKWDEIKEKRLEAAKNVDETVGSYKDLWDRLQEVVDKQGKVKKGYEDEAKLIAGELSEKLGIHIELVDGQIKKYDDLKDSIQEVITKKKAELLLKALEDDYTAAIKNRTEARSRLVAAEKGFSEAINDQKQAEQELTAAQNRLNEAKAYGAGYTNLYGKSMVELEEDVAAAQGRLDGATERVETFSTAINESKTDLKEAARTMTNYDDTLEAVANGGVAEMNQAMTIMTNSMKTAKNATVGELKEQTVAFYNEYREQAKAVRDGGGQAAKEAQAEAKKLLNAAVSELSKLDKKSADEIRKAIKTASALGPEWNKIGKNMASSLARGFKANSPVIDNTVNKAMKSAISSAKQIARIASPSKVWRDEIGFMMGKGLALGMEDADDLVQQAAEDWMETPDTSSFGDYEVASIETGGDGGAVAGGDIVINVYGAEGQDIKALADEIALRLQRMYKREVASFA